MPPPPGIDPRFAAANARGRGGLQGADGGAVETRLAAGRQSGVVNLAGLDLRDVPSAVFSIIDAPLPSSAPTYSGSFGDDAGGDRWWENESIHVPGGVAKLNLGRNALEILPDDLALLTGLRTLELAHNQLRSLPNTALAELGSLKLLDASSNQLTEFGTAPGSLHGLSALVKVDLSRNALQCLGPELAHLHALAELNVSGNALCELPAELCACIGLRTLQISDNQLVALPAAFGRLASLEELECGQNQLAELPETIGGCVSLSRIDSRQNRLSRIPASIVNCTSLRELHLGINVLTEDSIPALAGQDGSGLLALRILDLSDNDLRSAAAAVGLKALERLDIRNNELSGLTPELGLLSQLKWVGLDGNPLRTLRRELVAGPCSELLKFLRTRLEEEAELAAEPWAAGSPFDSHVREAAASGVLDLTGHDATDDLLPSGCFVLPDLHTLQLSSNKFTLVPAGVAADFAPTLVEINVSRNRIECLPAAAFATIASSLQVLNVSYNLLTTVHPIQELRSLRILNVTSAGGSSGGVTAEIATQLPPVGSVHCLEEFFGGFNRLRCVPKPLLSERWPSLQTIELGNNAVSEAQPSWFAREHMPVLTSLNIENNEISRVAPEFGLLGDQLKCFMIAGNPQRGVKHNILSKGSEATLAYLRSRCPTQFLDPGPPRQSKQTSTPGADAQGQQRTPSIGSREYAGGSDSYGAPSDLEPSPEPQPPSAQQQQEQQGQQEPQQQWQPEPRMDAQPQHRRQFQQQHRQHHQQQHRQQLPESYINRAQAAYQRGPKGTSDSRREPAQPGHEAHVAGPFDRPFAQQHTLQGQQGRKSQADWARGLPTQHQSDFPARGGAPTSGAAGADGGRFSQADWARPQQPQAHHPSQQQQQQEQPQQQQQSQQHSQSQYQHQVSRQQPQAESSVAAMRRKQMSSSIF